MPSALGLHGHMTSRQQWASPITGPRLDKPFFHSKPTALPMDPLTSRELYSVCVLPVCLYGSDSWLLTEPIFGTLEKFQGDLGKKILNIPKHYSNLIPLVALKWPTMRLRILHRKLEFLWHSYSPPKENITLMSMCSSHYGERALNHWSFSTGKCVRNSLHKRSPLTGRQQHLMPTYLAAHARPRVNESKSV